MYVIINRKYFKREGMGMEDNKIIDMYWERSQEAIVQTDIKYGKYCRYIASNILKSKEDGEECVNDTYLKAWDMMPPTRPQVLSAFLGKITRNLSLDRFRQGKAKKRGGGQVVYVLEELKECVPANNNVENVIDEMVLVETLNKFLSGLDEEKRKIFIRRYWYMSSVREIANEYEFTISKVKMVLSRVRNDLKELLEKEGIM